MTDHLDYRVLDVFTDRAFTGNPLAVVLGADDLEADQLQALAREFHLSETAFPLQPSEEERAAGADYRLRIFTPEVELPFAGHPSIGTAWLMAQLGRVTSDRIMQACGAGLVPLDVEPGGWVTLTGATPEVGEPVDASAALAAVGLSTDDLLGPGPRVASTGLGYLVVPVREAALASASPDLGALKAAFSHPSPATGIYLVAWQGEAGSGPPRSVAARMFAADIGVAEDPATGSAALAFGAALPALVGLPDGTTAVDVVQGVEMGRPSQLRVAVDVTAGRATAVRVSGQTVPVAAGTIAVPAVTTG